MSARTTAAPRALLAALVALVTLVGALGAGPGKAQADSLPRDPADPATPTTVTADPLPTVQIDGVVWSQVVVGTTVYAAGKFTSARPAGAPAGTSETPRTNLLAYDIRTGVLDASFAPRLNGQAVTVTASPDGSRVYVGGDFTEVDRLPRPRVAAFSTATGQLVEDFRPAVNAKVRTIAATGSTVYLGGDFTAVGSTGRNKLAAVSATTGALLPWAPQPGVGSTAGNKDGNKATSNAVLSLVVTSGGAQVVAAGRFDSLNGTKATGVGALDAQTGATLPFAVNRYITNQGVNSAIWNLSTDGTDVYGTGYNFYGPGNLEGLFAAAADGGAVRWFVDCYGDSYSTYATGDVVYSASHAHDCANIGSFPEQSPKRIHMFANAFSKAAVGTNSGSIGNPLRGQPAPAHQAWAPAFVPGTYTGQGQAGWTVTGNGDYVVYGGEFPSVNGFKQQGLVRFAVPSIAPNKVGPKTDATFTPTATMVHGAVRVGWTAVADADNEHLTYRVHRDSADSAPVCEVTQASLWWRLPIYGCADTGSTAGAHRWLVTVTDPFGNQRSSAWTTATVPAASAGTQRPYLQAVSADGAIDVWSLGEPSGSTGWDYAGQMDLTVNSGVTRAVQGAIQGDRDTATRFNGWTSGFAATRTAVTGPQVFSLETWIRTTTSSGGKILGFGNARTGTSTQHDRNVYMDRLGRLSFGVYPGTQRTVTGPASYNDGKWHHVVATLSRQGMVLYVDGARVAARTDTVSAEQFSGYWRIGGDTTWAGAPFFAGQIDEVAIYPTALSAEQVARHHLLGSTGELPNQAPTAVLESAVTELWVSLDGSGSTDPDGSVAGYVWDFGDGSTGTGATASHAYAEAGTYSVVLTVTDDDGATATATREVTVTAAEAGAPLVADGFERSVASGFGEADRGGAWATVGETSVSSGAGRLQLGVGRSASAYLPGGAVADVATQVAVSMDALPTGGGAYVYLAGRRLEAADYRASVKVTSTGKVVLGLSRLEAGRETKLTAVEVAGVRYTPGAVLLIRLEVTGTGTTALNAKAWLAGTAEPTGWQTAAGDSTPALQKPGGVGVAAFLSGSATAPVQVRVDDLWAGLAGTTPATETPPPPPANVPPAAAFGTAGKGLAAEFDGSASADPDGSITGYSWDFGDGATGSGVTATHTYAAAGTYEVRLTVTDDDGATGTVTQAVAVSSSSAPPAAADDSFGRTVGVGWGSADTGGAWSTTTGTSVSDGAGQLQLGAGRSSSAYLAEVAVTDVATQVAVSMDALPTGGGGYVYLAGRRLEAADYRASVKVTAAGKVVLGLSRLEAARETKLAAVEVAGVTYTPGAVLRVRLDLAGSGTTVLNAKAWLAGTAEPAAWQVTASDSTAALQGPGGVGVAAFLSGSATTPLRVSVDDLWAGPAGTTPTSTTPPPPPANAAPTATFESAVAGLTVSVDGSASVDADGSVTGYAWDFGDGSTGSGATVSHAYAEAGTYSVVLAVTDDRGATGTVTRQVSVTGPVTAPEEGAPLVADGFERSVASGFGLADVGGPWTMAGPGSVSGGAGSLDLAPGSASSGYLTGVAVADVATQVAVSMDALPTGGGAYVYLAGRRVEAADYRASVKVTATGKVVLGLSRLEAGRETKLTAVELTGVRYTPGAVLLVRLEVTGTGTTALNAKAWLAGTAEPTGWQATAGDSTPALQKPGGVGVAAFLSGTATAPVQVRVDDLWAGAPGTAPGAHPAG
ncbi:PKD domain-containing protein [Blastococcus sp. DSM 46786]|uniref:PKD domain-containing protein n=1 Tax=Blastococcus sp. DSM 46786 TaxID=1798227 RepID=UPI0008CF9E5E|nr:PKD domain-containing protein [Blastococcus sp. DSM 46786]SEL20596.1 PKD domain-containing protein [Blastococcus sp. DSM 46786]